MSFMGIGMEGWFSLEITEILRETDWAFLLRLKPSKDVWMPKSQVKDHHGYRAGDTDCTILITKYIARKRKFT